MIALRPLCLWIFAILSVVGLDACSGGSSGAVPQASAPQPSSRSGSSPIQHIVLIVQENRSFNNLFAGFPNATGTKV
jgi:phospholipase C